MVAAISLFFDFFKMAALSHLAFVECLFGPPRKNT